MCSRILALQNASTLNREKAGALIKILFLARVLRSMDSAMRRACHAGRTRVYGTVSKVAVPRKRAKVRKKKKEKNKKGKIFTLPYKVLWLSTPYHI